MKYVKKVVKVIGLSLLVFVGLVVVVSFIPGLRVQAAGWIEEAVQATAEYTKYPVGNYSLDFFIDTSWDWLPWNWLDGIGNGACYALYMITNAFWMLSAYFSYFIGFLVEQAFNMDVINKITSQLATNVQKIAGVSSKGFRAHGLLPSFAPLLIVIAGAYFAYLGLVKKQVTKAVNSLISFIVIFVLGMGVIAYSDDYLKMVNKFQKEFNKEVLTIGTSLTIDGEGDPVHGIRDQLFSVMIKKPYLLLQYGTSDVKEIGKERITKLLEKSPSTDAKERTDIVEEEVEDHENMNMSVLMIGMRFSMTFVTLLVNLVIGFCVALFCGVMILSQIMVVLYVSFFPVALVFCLFPNSRQNLSRYAQKLFENVFLKAGITLLLTIVFSISALFYSIAGNKNYFWTMFLQVVVFVGAVIKSRELLGFMKIGDQDSKQIGRRMGTFSRMMMGRMLTKGITAASGGRRGGGTKASGQPEGVAGQNPSPSTYGQSNRASAGKAKHKNNETYAGSTTDSAKWEKKTESTGKSTHKAKADRKMQEKNTGTRRKPMSKSGIGEQYRGAKPDAKTADKVRSRRLYSSPKMKTARVNTGTGKTGMNINNPKKPLSASARQKQGNRNKYSPEMEMYINKPEKAVSDKPVKVSRKNLNASKTEPQQSIRRLQSNTNNSVKIRKKEDDTYILNGKRGGEL